MEKRYFILSILLIILIRVTGNAQCANPANIYLFSYNGNSYEVVRENQTWVNAAACAVERGGFLTRIDDQNEQNAIFSNLINNAGINNIDTVAPDGGGASYVWIGGNDMAVEGVWIWDGDNDGVGDQFWQGDYDGNPVGGLYNNWGNEPDNYNNQDGLGLALTEWPLGSGTLGSPSEWNDVKVSNTLYYVIEYVGLIGVNDYNLNDKVNIYPNPSSQMLFVHTTDNSKIIKISLYDEIGKLIVENKDVNAVSNSMDVSNYKAGIYYIIIENEKGNFARELVIIK